AAIATAGGEVDADLVLVDERLHVPAERRDEPEVVEDHRPELEDEAAELLQRLADLLAEAPELLTGARCVAVEEPLADLGLQHDVRECLRRAVVHLPGQPAALLLLGLDDGLQE